MRRRETSPGEPADALLEPIERFVAEAPDPRSLENESSFMRVGVAAMSELVALGKITACVVRPRGVRYSRRNAPLLGLMVRMVKLYEGMVHLTAERRQELAEVFLRPFLEAKVKLSYLLDGSAGSARSFIETSFRAEKDILIHLRETRAQRPLMPLEDRILTRIRLHLGEAGMTQTALLARTNWNLDGKNMRELMRSVESGDDASGDLAYSFEFAKSSHAVHGTWIDLLNHHLEKRGRWYSADVGFTDPSPRFIGPPSALLADLLFGFARHFGLDSSGVLRELLHFFYWFFRAFDDAWEDKLEEMGFVPSL